MTLRSLVRAYVQADKYVTHSGVADYSSGEANVKPRRKVSGPTVTFVPGGAAPAREVCKCITST